MFIIFTGNGKGKTTAALGQAMRAVGNGSKVLMIEVIKGPWESGEDISSKKLAPAFKLVKKGKGCVLPDISKEVFAEHVHAAREALAFATKELETKKWNILILAELWNARNLGLLSSDEIAHFIDKTTGLVDHLICTGRDCPQQFISKADVVTEMRELKRGVVHSECN